MIPFPVWLARMSLEYHVEDIFLVAHVMSLKQGTIWLGQSPAERPAMGQEGQWYYLLALRVRPGAPAVLQIVGLRKSTGHSTQGGLPRLQPGHPESCMLQPRQLSPKEAAVPGACFDGFICHAATWPLGQGSAQSLSPGLMVFARVTWVDL